MLRKDIYMDILEKYNIELHDELNPRIWDEDNQLKPKIKKGILDIVNEFVDYIEYDLPVVDIVIVGSNASYNYTDKSDLDIHLIVNFENIDENKALVNALCQSWKTLFNKSYDIKLGGQHAELYVEDMQTSTNSNGIYSVTNDKWLKYPTQIHIPQNLDIEDDLVRVEIEIENALDSNDLQEVEKMIDWLYYQRKLALQLHGEFSVGNLIFKAVRNDGLLDKLKEKRLELKSGELTVEHFDKRKLIRHFSKHWFEYAKTDDRFSKMLNYMMMYDDFAEHIIKSKNFGKSTETDKFDIVGLVAKDSEGIPHCCKYCVSTQDAVFYDEPNDTVSMYKIPLDKFNKNFVPGGQNYVSEFPGKGKIDIDIVNADKNS